MTLIVMILGAIVAIDNLLAQVPTIKANSTFQLIAGWIAQLYSIVSPKV